MSFACNADVVFSISVLTLNFSCLLHSLLSFTPRGEKVPISYFIFRFILRRPFGMLQGADCHPWLSLLHETTDYFKTFFSLSPSINPKQCCCKGKSFLPDLHLLCPLQKPLFFWHHTMLRYLLLFYDFPFSTIIKNCLFHWETWSSWTIQWVWEVL